MHEAVDDGLADAEIVTKVLGVVPTWPTLNYLW